MKKNSYNFSVIAKSFIILFLLSELGHAFHDVVYQTAKYPQLAHKLMGDHGRNAVYHVDLVGVLDFFPVHQAIKAKRVQKLHKAPTVVRKVVKTYRSWLFRPDPGPRQVDPRIFFDSLAKGLPYTYVVLDDKLSFTESTADPKKEKFKNRFTKHYPLSGLREEVNFAGEFYIYKNPKNQDIFLVFDNASGTYQPPPELLPRLRKLLKANFYHPRNHLYFVTKTFEQKIDQAKLFAHAKNPYLSNQEE